MERSEVEVGLGSGEVRISCVFAEGRIWLSDPQGKSAGVACLADVNGAVPAYGGGIHLELQSASIGNDHGFTTEFLTGKIPTIGQLKVDGIARLIFRER
jgi:hypothetical protein